MVYIIYILGYNWIKQGFTMKKFFFVLIAVILVNCDLYKDSPIVGLEASEHNGIYKNTVKQSINSVRFVANGNCGKSNTSGKNIEIIRDDDTYNKILTEFGIKNDSVLKKIDFNNEILVIVIEEQKPSSGYHLQFKKVVDSLEGIFITTELLVPGNQCCVDAAFTTPYVIGAIPITNREIKLLFTERSHISAKVLYKGDYYKSGSSENTLELLNDNAAYHETLRNIGVPINESVKNVDFNSQTIVRVILSRKPSSGYRLSLKNVAECPDEDYFEVELTVPGKNCAVDFVLTEPYLLAVIPKTHKTMHLVINESIDDCQSGIMRTGLPN